MPSEGMTDFGVPVDKTIVPHINRINNITELNTTFSCSGLSCDHDGKSSRAYVVITTDRYVGKDLPPSPQYPHERDDVALRVYRAGVLTGWYAYYTTTKYDNINGVGAVLLSTSPSIPELIRLIEGNVTGNPVKTKYLQKKAKKHYQWEVENCFDIPETDDEKITRWDELIDELEREFELFDEL